MYKESWGLKRICPICSKQYYDLGRTELECPECGREIEVTTMLKPRRGRKPGSTNSSPLTNPVPAKPKEKENDLNIENIDLESNEEVVEDDGGCSCPPDGQDFQSSQGQGINLERKDESSQEVGDEE